MLARRQPDPGTQLRGEAELLEIAHRRHGRRGAHRADAHQRGSLLHAGVVFGVRSNAFVAPGDVGVERAPLRLRLLHAQPR